MRETGRSERIRTSDPLLPKQVRYQAALRSDRAGGLSACAGALQGFRRGFAQGQSRRPVRPISVEMRGQMPVSGRDWVCSTGVLAETVGRPSRRTM